MGKYHRKSEIIIGDFLKFLKHFNSIKINFNSINYFEKLEKNLKNSEKL